MQQIAEATASFVEFWNNLQWFDDTKEFRAYCRSHSESQTMAELGRASGYGRDLQGIYAWKNHISLNSYIGQTNTVAKRNSVHIRELHNGVNHTELMLNDFRKHGISSFSFTLIRPERDCTNRLAEEAKLFNQFAMAFGADKLYCKAGVSANDRQHAEFAAARVGLTREKLHEYRGAGMSMTAIGDTVKLNRHIVAELVLHWCPELASSRIKPSGRPVLKKRPLSAADIRTLQGCRPYIELALQVINKIESRAA